MSKKLRNIKWESVPLEGFSMPMTDKFQGFVGLEECTNYGLDKDPNCSKKKKRKNEGPNTEEIPSKKVKASNNNKKENSTKSKPVQVIKLSNGFTVESCNTIKPSIGNEDIVNSKPLLSKNNARNKRKRIKKLKEKKNKAKEDSKDLNNIIKGKKKPKTGKDTKQKIVEPNQPKIRKSKPRLGENMSDVVSDLTPEDMLTWAEFKLQEPIMRALMELGFKKPTKIQELSLPAAIHGRRDILGAAETGSGKTLAFGLPILSGILKLKEKAELGHDIYELLYKKTSAKRKKELEPAKKIKKGSNKKIEVNNKKKVDKAKESSEDGYGTDDEGHDTEERTETTNPTVPMAKPNEISSKVKNKDDDFVEEIEVPIRKRKETSADEGNDSSDSENFIHLSEMFDSDVFADSNSEDEREKKDRTVFDRNNSTHGSGDENDAASKGSGDESTDDANISEETDSNAESVEDANSSDAENDSDDGDKITNDVSDDEETESGDENETLHHTDDEASVDDADQSEDEEIVANKGGIGCVKVIDDVEMPGPTVVKTGKPLFALILTPTRELAIQISRHLIAVAKYTGIKIATIVGGMAAVKQERVLRSGPEIVVATPGRLWELITQGQPHLQQLDCVKFLAIDETDRMVERGHFEELTPLLERLNVDEARRGARQNFVFSATLTMVHELPFHMKGKKVTKRGKILNRKIEKMTPEQKVKRLVTMIGMTEPKVVDITTQNLGTAETLTECRIACSLEHKDAYLYYILKRHPGRTIVFCNSIGSVKRLAQLFTMLKCHPLPLHASMPQRQRIKNLERFRDDPHGVLVATDVAARGLDIPDVDHVVHYQVPRTAENYVHRSGRTARANKEGLTILMMEPSEAFNYAKLCRTLNKTAEVPTFPVPPHQLAPLKELVSVARELDALELKRRRAAQAAGWRDKAAREMDIIIDEDDLPMKQVDPSIDKALQAKKRQLESMIGRPLFPKGFSFKYPTLNDPDVFTQTQENALQVMKKAIESGELKKEKRKSKNAPLLKLQKNSKVKKMKFKKKSK